MLADVELSFTFYPHSCVCNDGCYIIFLKTTMVDLKKQKNKAKAIIHK